MKYSPYVQNMFALQMHACKSQQLGNVINSKASIEILKERIVLNYHHMLMNGYSDIILLMRHISKQQKK